MDVQELNKSQLIMLAILLSFVTSIATGITTVSLMQQMPASVTTPINRIVQQTVEKIVPGGISENKTIVIKEEDLVVDAIAKNQSAVFSISKEGFDETGKTIEISLGRGLVVSSDGLIAVDGSLVFNKEIYFVKNQSGKFKADFVSASENGYSLLKIGTSVDPKDKAIFSVPTIGELSKMKAGQKIIIIGNSIASFIFDGSKGLGMTISKNNAGALVSDLNGNALGIALANDTNSFVSISTIIDSLDQKNSPKL